MVPRRARIQACPCIEVAPFGNEVQFPKDCRLQFSSQPAYIVTILSIITIFVTFRVSALSAYHPMMMLTFPFRNKGFQACSESIGTRKVFQRFATVFLKGKCCGASRTARCSRSLIVPPSLYLSVLPLDIRETISLSSSPSLNPVTVPFSNKGDVPGAMYKSILPETHPMCSSRMFFKAAMELLCERAIRVRLSRSPRTQ